MKTHLLEKFENLMAAVTFAEKNDHAYALLLMNEENDQKKQNHSRKNIITRQDHRPQMRL